MASRKRTVVDEEEDDVDFGFEDGPSYTLGTRVHSHTRVLCCLRPLLTQLEVV